MWKQQLSFRVIWAAFMQVRPTASRWISPALVQCLRWCKTERAACTPCLEIRSQTNAKDAHSVTMFRCVHTLTHSLIHPLHTHTPRFEHLDRGHTQSSRSEMSLRTLGALRTTPCWRWSPASRTWVPWFRCEVSEARPAPRKVVSS